MKKLIKLEKDTSILYDSTITDYIDPEYVYIPIKKEYKILVKGNESIKKGQIIMENNLQKIMSPISGKIIDTKKMNIDGVIFNTIEIENDYKEHFKKIPVKEIKYNRESIISRLYEYHFNYLASILDAKKINNLIINAIDDEPYILNNDYIINKYIKEILEITDILATSFNISKSIVALKNNNAKNIEHLLSRIGTYPNINISLMEDKYLIGKDVFLLDNLGLKYEDSLVIDVKDLYEIYNAIKLNKKVYETFITVAGTEVAKSKVIKVKIGTRLSDIVENNIKILNNHEKEYILNGLMTGKECDINNTVVSNKTLGLLIFPKLNKKEYECNNCGLCYRICPALINPKKVMDKKSVNLKCIDCGLCSYICPCNINLRKYLRGEYE